MFKKQLLAGLVVIAAMAVGTSSAMAWTNTGSYTLNDVAGDEFKTVFQVPGVPELNCTGTAIDVTLNGGSQDAADVTGATLTGCTTNVASCTVSIATDTTPAWTLFDAQLLTNNTAQLSFAVFSAAFGGGGGCVLNGVTVPFGGNAVASVSYPTTGCGVGAQRTRFSFSNQPGLLVSPAAPGLANGTALRLSGSFETACAGSAFNPEMQS